MFVERPGERHEGVGRKKINYKDGVVWRWNHLVQGELVFCEVVHFVSDSWHMIPACSWWSDYYERIYVYSLLFWQDGVNFMALPIVIYSVECDGCACRECHIHCPTRWCESCHWQWYLLERIEFGRALSERSWYSPRLKKSLFYNVRPTC